MSDETQSRVFGLWIGRRRPLFGTLVVIFVGAFIAVIGLVAGLSAQPGDSAPRQTVAALWMIEGSSDC
jgi:hypothetical protein